MDTGALQLFSEHPKSELRRIMSIRLQQLRERHGLTQIQLAELLGVSQSYISSVETGEDRISERLRNKVCVLLGANSLSDTPLNRRQITRWLHTTENEALIEKIGLMIRSSTNENIM